MRRWLIRLAFSFIILAAVFAWEGYKARHAQRDWWPAAGYFVAAAALLALGLTGVKARHRDPS